MSRADAVNGAEPVPDDRLLEAIRAADSRTVNGLPDAQTIADQCRLTRAGVSSRLNTLEERGFIELHQSVAIDTPGGTIRTVEVLETQEGER